MKQVVADQGPDLEVAERSLLSDEWARLAVASRERPDPVVRHVAQLERPTLGSDACNARGSVTCERTSATGVLPGTRCLPAVQFEGRLTFFISEKRTHRSRPTDMVHIVRGLHLVALLQRLDVKNISRLLFYFPTKHELFGRSTSFHPSPH